MTRQNTDSLICYAMHWISNQPIAWTSHPIRPVQPCSSRDSCDPPTRRLGIRKTYLVGTFSFFNPCLPSCGMKFNRASTLSFAAPFPIIAFNPSCVLSRPILIFALGFHSLTGLGRQWILKTWSSCQFAIIFILCQHGRPTRTLGPGATEQDSNRAPSTGYSYRLRWTKSGRNN